MLESPTAFAPLPHRKVLRGWLQALSGRSTRIALSLAVVDFAWLGLMLAGAVFLHWLPLQLLCGAVAGFVIGRLFILGHDACHHSFTVHKPLNRWLGRLLLLPSLTPYSLWDIGHNVVHHGYTNLKDFDFVWQPKSLDEYRALSPGQRLLERLYRSGWAPWLYYGVEIWWRRMFFPNRRYMPTQRRVFFLDSLLVAAFACAWIGALAAAADATGQSLVRLLVAGFILPQLVWNAMIGFVVYVHHTHRDVAWYTDKAEWGRSQPFVSTTVHLQFSSRFGLDWGRLVHHITEHTAHHLDMTIPLYRLREAQSLLEEKLPGRIVVQPFSWRWYFQTARDCKLYDYDAKRWLGFDGQAAR